MRKTLFALVLLLPASGFAQWGKLGSVTIRPSDELPKKQLNIGAAREVQRALSFIPNSERLDWTIDIASHERIQRGATHKVFPARCFTHIEKRETLCDIEWVMDASGMALAGTLAHEYGHILCGSKEDDADRCGAELMHGVPPDRITSSN
jgi:hypothetical protein